MSRKRFNKELVKLWEKRLCMKKSGKGLGLVKELLMSQEPIPYRIFMGEKKKGVRDVGRHV